MIFPIFINWHSQLWTWVDRVGRIRDGRYKPVQALSTLPFALLNDAGRTAGRLPEVYLRESLDMVKNFPLLNRDIMGAPTAWAGGNISIYSNGHYPSYPSGNQGWSHSTSLLGPVLKVFPGVVRVGTIPILDFVLYESYQMMLRRIDMLFRTENDYKCADEDINCGTVNSPVNTGAISLLMKKLSDDGKEITLIGHSMGAIVVNEIVRRYSDSNINKIIYMAAACTSKDFMDTIPPYLDRKNKNIPNSTQFYSLSLHPLADKDEVSGFFGHVLPSGSLLEWLDSYVHRVKTPLDLTFGKWNNAMKVLPLLEGYDGARVKNNIFIKGFPVDGDNFPSTHGSFGKYSFWDQNFWNPNLTINRAGYTTFFVSPKPSLWERIVSIFTSS